MHEAMVLRDAVLQSLLLNNSPKMVPILYAVTDSKSLWANIHSTNQASDLKLRREIQCIRQHIELEEVEDCYWTSSQMMLADCLTKKTASPDNLIDVLTTGVINIDISSNSM